MSQFSITLPDSRQVQVKSGNVFQKGVLGRVLSSKKNISKRGYFVRTASLGEISKITSFIGQRMANGPWIRRVTRRQKKIRWSLR